MNLFNRKQGPEKVKVAEGFEYRLTLAGGRQIECCGPADLVVPEGAALEIFKRRAQSIEPAGEWPEGSIGDLLETDVDLAESTEANPAEPEPETVTLRLAGMELTRDPATGELVGRLRRSES